MAKLTALELLPGDSRLIVAGLLGHRALQRLGSIGQLGFTGHRQQSRLRHTVGSLELAAAMLARSSITSPTVRNHLLAAIALEDVGRAPFSNSLDPIFTAVSGMTDRLPIDIERSIVVIEHLEKVEGLLSKRGLSPSIVRGLLEGTVGWSGAQWVKTLIGGPTDIDRLQYVAGDIASADGRPYDVSGVARGMILDDGGDTTIIEASSLPSLIDFLLQRARLFMQVYYEPAKLATETVVREFLKTLWNFLGDAHDGWPDLAEPRSVEDFLRWTDGTLLDSLDGERWKEVPDALQRLRQILLDGGLQVAELRQQGTALVNVDVIETLFVAARQRLIQREHCWALSGDELPSLQAYQPGTVSILLNRRYRDLAATHEVKAIPVLTQRMRRCPVIVFPTAEFGSVQSIIHETGLLLSTVIPLNSLRSFRSDYLV